MSDDLGMYITVKADGVTKVNKELDEVAKKADRAEKGMNSLAVVVATFASTAAIKSTLGVADSYATMSARMRLATESAVEFTIVQKHLLDVAKKTGRSLEEVQQIFIDTNGNLKDMGYSTLSALRITDSFSYALTRNATSAQKAQSALAAFDYALNKKKVDVTTWKSISSAIPTLEVDMARVFSKSLSEIQQMGYNSMITVQDINRTLLESYDENEQAAQALGSSLASAKEYWINSFADMVGGVDGAISATQGLASTIEFAADNMDLLLIPVAGVATVGLVKGFVLARNAVIAFNVAVLANPLTLVAAGAAMAGVALLSYASSAKKAENAITELNDSIAYMHEDFRNMTDAMREEHEMKIKIAIDHDHHKYVALQDDIEKLQNRLENMRKLAANGASRYVDMDRLSKSIQQTESDLIKMRAESDRFGLSIMANQDRIKELITFTGEAASKEISYSEQYLSAQEKISEQVLKRNLKGVEGNVIYERSFGILKDITEEEFKALQLRAQSVDVQFKMLDQQDQIANKLEDINTRYAKAGMTALNSEIYDLKAMGLSGDDLDDAIAKLTKIYSFQGGTSLSDVFKDRLVSISQELSSMQALNSEMATYGQPSKYNAVRELTLEFENQASALYKLSDAQKNSLLVQARQLDSQTQMNEIISMSFDAQKEIDDLIFEAEMRGKLADEVDRLTFFRNIDTKAREISIGMSQENIAALNEEIAKIKELYDLYKENVAKDDNDYFGGMSDGLNSFLDDAGTARSTFEDATKGALTSMTDGLADFVATGKMDFKSLTQSILQDIARITARWAMAQAMGGFMGAMGFGGIQAWSGGYIPEYASGGSVVDFSGGGFTGNGGKYEPKGVVHGGEYVLRKEVVQQIGIDKLDRINKGYSNGGFVGNAGGLGGGNAGVVINQTLHIAAGASIDEDMIAMLKYELQSENMKLAKNISLETIGDQKRNGGLLRV